MIKILSIAKYDLLKLIREKSTLPVLILMPVILTFVMGLAMREMSSGQEIRIPVGITNYDKSAAGRSFLEEVKKDGTIDILECEESELIDKVKNADVEIGFIIPEDFGTGLEEHRVPEIRVLKLPASADFIAMEGILSSAYTRLQAENGIMNYFEDRFKTSGMPANDLKLMMEDISQRVKDSIEKTPLVTVKASRYSGKNQSTDFDGKAQSSLGFAVMFVMFTLVMSAGDILDEKKNNTWGRLGITPTGKSTIMLGKILGTFIRGWAQLLFLILFGSTVMGVGWGNSLAATVLLMSVYLLSVTSIGFFLASLVKTNAQLGAMSSIFIICTSMLSGCMWPTDIMPPEIQKAAVIFPQYWAMKGLTNTVVGNMGIASLYKPLLVLTLIGIIFFILNNFIGRFGAASKGTSKPTSAAGRA